MARAEVHVKLTEVNEVKELLAAAAERIQQLEATISSVRALHREHEGRCVACVEWCDCFDSTKELGNDREVARAAMLCPHGNVSWRCPTIAALDSSGIPEPGPVERSREQARAEVELVQRWWLRSGGINWRMAGPNAARDAKAEGFGGMRPDELTVSWDFEFRPSSSRFFDAPPFPGDSSGTVEDAPEEPAPTYAVLGHFVDKRYVWDPLRCGYVDGEGELCGYPIAAHESAPAQSAQLPEERSDEPYNLNAEDCSRCDLNTMSYPFICPGHPAPERSDEAPKYRWRVQFISTPEDGVEEEMGRYDFADETEARPAFERYGAEYRDLEFWRVELRRQQVSDWETVEDTGYAAPVDGETTNA